MYGFDEIIKIFDVCQFQLIHFFFVLENENKEHNGWMVYKDYIEIELNWKIKWIV